MLFIKRKGRCVFANCTCRYRFPLSRQTQYFALWPSPPMAPLARQLAPLRGTPPWPRGKIKPGTAKGKVLFAASRSPTISRFWRKLAIRRTGMYTLSLSFFLLTALFAALLGSSELSLPGQSSTNGVEDDETDCRWRLNHTGQSNVKSFLTNT